MADNTAKIAELRAILQSGVTTISVDGTTTTVDLNQIRLELRQLIAEDDTQKTRKPRLSSVNLGGLM